RTGYRAAPADENAIRPVWLDRNRAGHAERSGVGGAEPHEPGAGAFPRCFLAARKISRFTTRLHKHEPKRAGTDVRTRDGHCGAAAAAWRRNPRIAAHRHIGSTAVERYLGRLSPRLAAHGSLASDAGYRRFGAVGYR